MTVTAGVIILAFCFGWYYTTACDLDIAKLAISNGMHQVQQVGTNGVLWVK